MKKICIFVFFMLFMCNTTAGASPSYDKIMSEKIAGYGVFYGTQGIVYADEKNFENRNSLFLVHLSEAVIHCEVYDEIDGIQLTDTLEFPCTDKNVLSVVKKNGTDYIVFSYGSTSEFFTMQNDSFTHTEPISYDTSTHIVTYENGKFTSHIPTQNIFNFLNRQKEHTIAEYPFSNSVDLISAEETAQIKSTLAACADIMSFDIKDYNYDLLFKYILYTHKNFQILTDISPDSENSSPIGYNNVSLVRSDFIDYVMENVFRITPEKPPVNTLISRGFCYNDGYYYYTGGFDVFFSTQILDLIGVYDIGGGVTFVIFSDIYRENDIETPEYSFAVLQNVNNSYSVLRLGMGENLPSDEDIKKYSPFSSYSKINVKSTAVPTKETSDDSLLLPFLLFIIAVGSIGFICSVIVLIRQRKE